MFPFRGRPPASPEDPLAKVRRLLREGVEYEDEFIEMYLRVIRDEGFSFAFGSIESEAKTILTTLVDESTWHKSVLEDALKKIK